LGTYKKLRRWMDYSSLIVKKNIPTRGGHGNCKRSQLTWVTAKDIPHSMKIRIAVVNWSLFKHFRCCLIN
jgi:hypothetical protein